MENAGEKYWTVEWYKDEGLWIHFSLIDYFISIMYLAIMAMKGTWKLHWYQMLNKSTFYIS